MLLQDEKKKDACMLFWVSYLMRWKGTPKMCDVDS